MIGNTLTAEIDVNSTNITPDQYEFVWQVTFTQYYNPKQNISWHVNVLECIGCRKNVFSPPILPVMVNLTENFNIDVSTK